VRAELKEMGALEDVILRCLQKRPNARYENLAALLADLDKRLPRAQGGNGARLAGSPLGSLLADELELPSRVDAPPLRRRRLVPAVVVTAAFMAGLLLVVLLRRLGQDSSAPHEPESVPRPAVSSTALPVVAPPAPARLTSASAGVAAPAPSARSALAPTRKPSPTPPRPAAAPVPRKRKPPSGEIIDPWAN
jgi:hypothetical protein